MMKMLLFLIATTCTILMNAQSSNPVNMEKQRNIFESEPTENGHTWTVVSRLGHIIEQVEYAYGPRDKAYSILGIEITTAYQPQIWYPKNNKNVIIQITENCLHDMNRAVFQIAHEAVHCLSPTGNSTTNFLEEGLATRFSIDYCVKNGFGQWKPNIDRYMLADSLVLALLKVDKDIVRKLRQIQPTISEIDEDLILEINKQVPSDLAQKLCKKFK